MFHWEMWSFLMIISRTSQKQHKISFKGFYKVTQSKCRYRAVLYILKKHNTLYQNLLAESKRKTFMAIL